MLRAVIMLTMEDGVTVIWEGEGEDREHCQGLAIAYATDKTGQQVLYLSDDNIIYC